MGEDISPLKKRVKQVNMHTQPSCSWCDVNHNDTMP